MPRWRRPMPPGWRGGPLHAHQRCGGCGSQGAGHELLRTPTGWKFFDDLLDDDESPLRRRASLAATTCGKKTASGPCCSGCRSAARRSVAEIMAEHWNVSPPLLLASRLRSRRQRRRPRSLRPPGIPVAGLGQPFAGRDQQADNFSYTDPVDGSVTRPGSAHPLGRRQPGGGASVWRRHQGRDHPRHLSYNAQQRRPQPGPQWPWLR